MRGRKININVGSGNLFFDKEEIWIKSIIHEIREELCLLSNQL